MFRNISGDGSSSPTGHGVASPGLNSQESSWIGLLSVVSRPAVSFLQKYLPGRARNPVLSDPRAGWMSGDLKSSFVDEESDFLSQLDNIMPLTQHRAPHLTYLRCQHDGAAGLLEPEGGGALPWLTADSLREIGIDSGEEMNLCPQTQVGHLSSARTFLSHVWLNSEVRPMGGQDWVKSRPWWGSLWGSEESSWAEDRTLTGRLCPQQPAPETKGSETTESVMRWRLGEHTGPTDHKDANNGGQNTEGSEPDHRLSIRNHLSRPGPLTPDQDNGYSSLEEEQLHLCRLYLLKPPTGPEPETGPTETSDAVQTQMEEESPEESTSGEVEEEEEEEKEKEEAASEEVTEASTPQCQNKSIAFIMGCSFSDDSTDDDDDDAGFDSDSSSDEEDEDESDSDSVDESEVEDEHLWRTWCHSTDPYNPLNFTAQLHSSTAPRTIPPTTPPSSTQSTPTSSPDLTPLPLSSPPLPSSSPPSSLDVWDDSTSASEADEAESLRLWRSFSCSSDPYSPLNFQAPLRTQDPVEAGPRARTKTRKTSQTGPRHTAASPPEYRKEEAEERLDSGFSEPCASSSATRRCSTTKKVRFCDVVEEFFTSGGEEDEDRHGPWEELARDRCRFLRRCQEVEQSIAYCLQPQHRRRVYRRLATIYTQDA